MLPVPLNSSKMTSSMRLPVSISAVAMMVSDPPSWTLQSVGVNTTGEHLAGRRRHRVVSARQARDGIEQHNDIALVLDQPLGFFQNHFRNLNVALRRFVKRRADHFALHRALHVRDFFRAL